MTAMAGAQLRGNTLLIRSEAPLVGHSQWMAKAISEAKANGHGLALLTPDTTKLTRALNHLFEVLGIMWVVEDGRGNLFIGSSGQRVLEKDGQFYGQEELVPGYSRTGVAQDRGGVLILAEALKPRRFTTEVGPLAEAVARTLTGREPLGWGVQEPVTQPWSVQEISHTYSKAEAAGHYLHFTGAAAFGVQDGPGPESTKLSEPGSAWEQPGRLAGTLEIQKPRNGIVEHVEAACELPNPWGPEQKMAFAETMHRQGTRWATAFQTVGADPTLITPFFTGFPVPSVAVFGREALDKHDVEGVLELARSLGAEHCEVLGEKRRRTLAVMFSGEADEDRTHPAEIYSAVQQKLMGEFDKKK